MVKKAISLFVAVLMMVSVCVTSVYAIGNDTELLPDKTYESGDVNTDGQVNIVDVTTMQKYIVNLTTLSEYQVSLANVDGKERLDIKDATYLQKKLQD